MARVLGLRYYKMSCNNTLSPAFRGNTACQERGYSIERLTVPIFDKTVDIINTSATETFVPSIIYTFAARTAENGVGFT